MNNADKQYQTLLSNIMENGRQKGDRTGTGTISIPYATLDFEMSEGFPLLTTKKVFTKAIIHELLWFINGDTNIKYLEDNGVSIWSSDAYREYSNYHNNHPIIHSNRFDILSKEDFITKIKSDSVFAKQWGELGPVYGAQWRNWKQGSATYNTFSDGTGSYTEGCNFIDQIQEAMTKLINNPDDRRIIVSAWNVAEIDKMALPPCHYMFQLYSEELTIGERLEYLEKNNINTITMGDMNDSNKLAYLESLGVPKRALSLIWDQRSCDTFLGIPFNIASYGILLHMFSQQANMIPGRLIGSLKNVHIYNNHKDQCLEQVSREPKQLPKLVLRKAKDIFSYTYDDIRFINYNPHDKIVGAISV